MHGYNVVRSGPAVHLEVDDLIGSWATAEAATNKPHPSSFRPSHIPLCFRLNWSTSGTKPNALRAKIEKKKRTKKRLRQARTSDPFLLKAVPMRTRKRDFLRQKLFGSAPKTSAAAAAAPLEGKVGIASAVQEGSFERVVARVRAGRHGLLLLCCGACAPCTTPVRSGRSRNILHIVLFVVSFCWGRVPEVAALPRL